MREKQVLIMPIDNKYKFRNMLWSDALTWAKTDDEGLTEIIEKAYAICISKLTFISIYVITN